MRDSCIFYKSFYDSIKNLEPKDQVIIYNAIFEYQFNGNKVELSGVCDSIFTLIIPQLEANNQRYENGKKGGRPKTKIKPKDNQNETKTKPKRNQNETKTKPNENENVNVNVNVNDNVNVYEYIENAFGRTFNQIEYELISNWEDNELTKYAIKKAVLNGKYNLKYIDTILFNYKKNNIKTVAEAQLEEENHKNNKDQIPKWFDKDLKKEKEEYTKEEQEIYDYIK